MTLAHDLNEYDVQGMLSRAPGQQLVQWAAWYEVHGPQGASRIDIAADRIVAATLNPHLEMSKRLPFHYWHTEQNAKPKKMTDQQIEDNLRIVADIEAQRAINIQRAAELKRNG